MERLTENVREFRRLGDSLNQELQKRHELAAALFDLGRDHSYVRDGYGGAQCVCLNQLGTYDCVTVRKCPSEEPDYSLKFLSDRDKARVLSWLGAPQATQEAAPDNTLYEVLLDQLSALTGTLTRGLYEQEENLLKLRWAKAERAAAILYAVQELLLCHPSLGAYQAPQQADRTYYTFEVDGVPIWISNSGVGPQIFTSNPVCFVSLSHFINSSSTQARIP